MKEKRIMASLKAMADLKILLVVFGVVLASMVVFAHSFKESHIGYVEEKGYAVASKEVYDQLSKAQKETKNIHLSAVLPDDEIIMRGDRYFVGEEFTEYEGEYPFFANDGRSVYFVTDSAELVTEEFELLDTYYGMFVADGNSFNMDRQQADIEDIYFVKLKNGLYLNSMPVTFTKNGVEISMPVNSIVHFEDNTVRFYDENQGVLEYNAIEDMTGFSIQIGEKQWFYPNFMDLLTGKIDSSETGEEPGSEEVPEIPAVEEEAEGVEEAGEEEKTTTSDRNDKPESSKDSSSSSNQESEQGDSNQSESVSGSEGNSSAGDVIPSEGESTSAPSESDKSENNKDETEDKEEDAEGSNKPVTNPGQGDQVPMEPPYQKPEIIVKEIVAGTYWVNVDVEIVDEYGYLKKLTSRIRWNDGQKQQRKSVKDSGEFTINNLESDKEMTLVFEMKYRNPRGEYVTEEVYSTKVKTLSIADGTDTLYLDYVPDTWDPVEKKGGYGQILPEQIEIHNIKIEEGNDAKIEDEHSTMDYVRYFRIKVFDPEKSRTNPVASYALGNADKQRTMTEDGLMWKSDSYIMPLEPNKDYYYEFELVDRYGESLKVVYEKGENDFNRYDGDGNLLMAEDSDRLAYTCKKHPTGKLTLGSASYDTQQVNVTLNNPNLSTVSDLYLTVQDVYGRYIEYEVVDGDEIGKIGTAELTNQGRFMLLEGVIPEGAQSALPVYSGAKEGSYKQSDKEASWSRIEIPSFADSTYTINMNIRYDIGDRTGNYTKVLASRSNSKTTTLGTLGNVSFSRLVDTVEAHKVGYSYASVEISERLLPLIYRYEYLLQNNENAKDTPLKLLISKEYDEIKGTEGVVLTIPEYGEQKANDFSFHYSYQYRMRNDVDRTIHTVNGKIYQEGNSIVRTIYLNGNPLANETIAITAEKDLYAAFCEMLNLGTCADVRNDASIKEEDIIVERATMLSMDFAPIVDNDGTEVLNVNDRYNLQMSYEQLQDAFQYMQNQSDRDFSDIILCALSRYRASLTIEVSGLESAQIYTASAKAYAYQTGALDVKTDENGNVIYGEKGEPKVTLVTNTDTNLQVQTLKGEPQVHMELFSTSSEMTLFEFYVLDKDGAIVAKSENEPPSITVALYKYDVDEETGEATETLVDRRMNISPYRDSASVVPQDITFGGLLNGQTYRIKVTAKAYDITPDGSATRYDQLIGASDGTTFWQENGIWDNVIGTAVTTGVMLEEVLATEPFTLQNQLLDYSSADMEENGWEANGYLDYTTGELVADKSYMSSGYMDLRKTDANGDPIPLSIEDTFLMRGIYVDRVYLYDINKEYMGYFNNLRNGTEKDGYAIVKIQEQLISGPSTGDYSIDQIVYARVSIANSRSNVAFFGRLDDGYLTAEDKNSAAEYTDIWASYDKKILLKDLGGNVSAGRSYKKAIYDASSNKTLVSGTQSLTNYYKDAIPIEGNQVIRIVGPAVNAEIERNLVFFDEEGDIILNESEAGSQTYIHRVYRDTLCVAPKAAASMMISYDSRTQESAAVYLMNPELGRAYNEWRRSQGILNGQNVSKYKNLNSAGALIDGSVLQEVVEVTDVKPGDIFHIGNWSSYVSFYDAAGKVIGTDAGSAMRTYVVAPENTASMKVANHRWSENVGYDNSILNGATYNEGGACRLVILKCGNLKDVYYEKLKAGKSEDGMYANLRVQLKDGVNNYFTDGLSKPGSYWLEVYEADYEGRELSDEELMASPMTKQGQGTIRIINGNGEEINRCTAIPVKKGKSYKVVLRANVGSRSSVELGSTYFTVREEGADIYGIASNAQFKGIYANAYGDYILGKDIVVDTTNYTTTFYGELDLQGHTITNKNSNVLFHNLGSLAKRQGAVRNGTLIFESIRGSGGGASRFATGNYGTIENIHFKINNENPYTVIDGKKIYDNSNWTNEQYVSIISNNQGILQNFTVEYLNDYVSCHQIALVEANNGLIQNGYAYGDGDVYGGAYVGAIISYNQAAGTARNLYSTIDVKSNNNPLGSPVTTTAGAGTVIGQNRGKAEGILSTGNVYQYTATKQGSNYQFLNETIYPEKGCAIGTTTTRMDTSRTYYATVGNGRRVNYNPDSKNERVETGMLLDPEWFLELFEQEGLDKDNLENLLAEEYYPWIDMGCAAEKYNLTQPYLSMNIGESASFDLTKSEVLDYIFDKDGFAYANVKFSFMNPSSYEVTDIMLDGLDCTITSQRMNELKGFYEVQATVKVPENGKYVSGYAVKAVYYRRSANSSKSSVRYSYGTYTSTLGERILAAEFYYPLKNTMEWTEIFVEGKKDWNFRIWGDEVWDFSKPYYYEEDGTQKSRFPQSVKTFEFFGNLDGTLYVEGENGRWIPAVDGGQTKCHVLKNLSDYTLNYNIYNQIGSYTLNGYILHTVHGKITNLIIDNMTNGVEREYHRAILPMKNDLLSKPEELFTIPSGEKVRQTKGGAAYRGFINTLQKNAVLENIHVKNAYMNPYLTGSEIMGGLAATAFAYCTYTDCSVTNSTFVSSIQTSSLYVGGIVGISRQASTYNNCYTAGMDIQLPLSENTAFSPNGCGGLIGYAESMTMMYNCYSAGTMESAVMNTGGIIGRNVGTAELLNCYSAMNLSLNNSNGAGIVGKNESALTIENCLYTGALSAASQSNTIHLMVGYSTGATTLRNCYVYQPHLEEDSSLLDLGVQTRDYHTLTAEGAEFYRSLFGEEYLYDWTCGANSCNTTAQGGAYLPALKNDNGGILSGQIENNRCLVPAIAEETLQIQDVWAFSSVDRNSIAEKANQELKETPPWYGSNVEAFYEALKDYGIAKYEPNDVEFTLVLGSRPDTNTTNEVAKPRYKIRSIQIEGLESGTMINKTNFDNQTGLTDVFQADMLESKLYRFEVKEHPSDDVFAYDIRMLGMEVISYRDIYNIIVTLDNGVVLKQTFQFRNSEGVEEEKFLKIANAYEWNLYLGKKGNLATLAEQAAEGDPLYPYKGSSYKGYGSESMNIEITGVIDFNELRQFDETPVINVLVNQMRGNLNASAAPGQEDRLGAICNLNVTVQSSCYGLIKNASSHVKNIRFDNNTIHWKNNAVANGNSGLLGTVSGNVEYCDFKNTTLTGGGSYFGIIGSCNGTIGADAADENTAKKIRVINSFIESDGSQVGALVGALRGDIYHVESYGNQVAGTDYIGGLVGRLYSTDHAVNGHEIIGGADYTVELAEGETERENLNENGWYSRMMTPDNYIETSETYQRDSLSHNYAHMKNITVHSTVVNARRNYIGGVIGQATYINKAMGYGYLIAENIKVGEGVDKEVYIRSANTQKENVYAGGFVGSIAASMIHNVEIDGVIVEADGNYAGGVIGYHIYRNDYDYSAFGSDGSRRDIFLSVLNHIRVKNVIVHANTHVGGINGHNWGVALIHDVEAEQISIFGNGSRVGGLYGTCTNAYPTDFKVSKVNVYNSGTASQYTGGVFGFASGSRSLSRFDISDVSVSAYGESDMVGGVFGYLEVTHDGTKEQNHVRDIYVYGHSRVGGLVGVHTNVLHDISVNQPVDDGQGGTTEGTIEVTGTGYYVGGLVGESRSSVRFIDAKNLKVTGYGMATGGIIGYKTGGDFRNIKAESVAVTATGSGTSDGTVYIAGEAVTGLPNGSVVGGLIGSLKDLSTYYITAKDILVHGSSDYIGGFVGNHSKLGELGYISMDDVEIYADGQHAKYIGGIVGYGVSSSNYTRTALNNCYISAPNAAGYVGGYVGYRGGGSTTAVNWNMVEAEIYLGNAPAKYVGGVIGYMDNVSSASANTVEIIIYAPNSEYVGGVVGYGKRDTSLNFSMNRIISVADIYAKNYVSAIYGYIDGYRIKHSGAYGSIAAARIKTTEENAVASYFYNYNYGNEIVSDRHTMNNSYANEFGSYPYYNRLWDGSSIQKGGAAPVLATEQKFSVVTSATTIEEKKLTYWTSGYANDLRLVSNENLKNLSLYQYMSYSYYSPEIIGNRATFDDITHYPPTDDRWNMFGIYSGMCQNGRAYLPVPLNPLRMSAQLTEDMDGVNRRVDYYFGNATVEGNTLVVNMTDGVCLPGTPGSILEAGYSSGHIPSLGPVINLHTEPKVYATNAYTLNFEFGTKDVFEGAWIEVYTKDATGNRSAAPIYEVQAIAEAGKELAYSYSMYYDFMADLAIDVVQRNGAERVVVHSKDIKAADYRSRICMGGDIMFALGNDGKVYQYRSSWGKGDVEEVNITGLQADEKCINLLPDGQSSISVLTDKGHILYVSNPLQTTNDRYLKAPVSAAKPENLQLPAQGNLTADFFPERKTDELKVVKETLVASATETLPSEVFTSEEVILESDSDVEFDKSLLTAEPLYEFDYKGYHICTYLNYSLIFDGDNVTVRNMQLFVKNGQLFALNAPEEVVPGCVVIDNYQGHAYMTVLSKDGRMVDLMDSLHYPDDFRNYGIKKVATNLYSDLTYVQVEYKDGSIVAFNYHTGSVLYAEEGEGSASLESMDFLDYILVFFHEKIDSAYADISAAYQNALAMEEFLSNEKWQEWFEEASESAIAKNENIAEASESVVVETMESEETAASSEGEAGEEWMTYDGFIREEEDAEDFMADETILEEAEMSESGAEAGSEESGAEEQAEEVSAGEVEDENSEEVVLTDSKKEALADELIIAYDAQKKEYGVYSAEDLLTEDEEKLTSVDKKMEELEKSGAVIEKAPAEIGSLAVDQSQKTGLIILGVTGGVIAVLLAVLGIQKFSKGQKKVRRR